MPTFLFVALWSMVQTTTAPRAILAADLDLSHDLAAFADSATVSTAELHTTRHHAALGRVDSVGASEQQVMDGVLSLPHSKGASHEVRPPEPKVRLGATPNALDGFPPVGFGAQVGEHHVLVRPWIPSGGFRLTVDVSF